MLDFTYTPQPTRIVFAKGSLARIADEVGELGGRRALVLCTPGQRPKAQRVADLLGTLAAGIHDGAAMHVPIEHARRARAHVHDIGADILVAIGGGSAIGLAKAVALETGLPIVAIPTTYAGSEMTPIYGITEAGVKTTGRDPRVLPRTVLYDPDLSATLPVATAATSGINAIAHAVEGLYARDGNPVASLMSEEGISAMANGLRGIAADRQSEAARADCLYGAWLCGTVLGQVGMALHHKLCHTLGGSFDLPHAETHTIVLPHALAFNAVAAPDAAARVARAIGAEDAAAGLQDLARLLGAPTALRDIGMDEADLDRACEMALANPYWNPRPVQAQPLRDMLRRAWEGAPPQG